MNTLPLTTRRNDASASARYWATRARDLFDDSPFRLALNVLSLSVIAIVYALLIGRDTQTDAYAYWQAWRGPMFDSPWHAEASYVYSPAFAQVLYPLTLLPWEAFRALWIFIEIAVLVLLAGPVLAAMLLIAVQPVLQQIDGGNIDLMLGLALALGVRHPGAWAFVLLTKVTPGVGLVWFALRREWKRFAIALVVAAAIAAVSFAAAPGLWIEWLRLLGESVERKPDFFAFVVVEAPLWVRLLAGLGIVTWGALTDRPWTLVLAAYVASPLAHTTGATMLLGALPLLGWGPMARFARSAGASQDQEQQGLESRPALPARKASGSAG